MSNCSTDHQVHTEKKTMEQELQWLLTQRIPKVVLQAQASLLGISLLGHKAGTGRGASTDPYIHLHDTRTGEDVGEVSVSGASVAHLSLLLPVSTNTQPTRRTTTRLKKDETLPLRQAQEALSFIKSATKKTRLMPRLDSKETALDYVENMLSDVKRARQILTIGSQLELMPLQSDSTEKFAPALPENLVIECKFKEGSIVVHLYFLKFRRGVKSSGGILDAFKKDTTAGHMLVHNGRLAEVKQELIFQAPLSIMASDLDSLDQAANLLIDVVGQLHAFDSM
ncbi:hypothetical protein GGH92_002193 [Coemansia sp. RSA 2673]|nr:hypothetical protein LPJ71_002407 [Coemansia sp. S17]KAJ2032096.1 hypothetical protein H4S03_006363 [Coemansia sp. S3946]KAJ2069348.1 hypothetical protein GGH13_004567 [Coemansia sp. S155-1]KAJ2350763.1 hypothetical protein GGH92_002193 [Coemansia sp. RSA 2673]